MLTRVDVETATVSLCRDALKATGRSLAHDGTNPDLNEPMAKSLANFGVTPAVRADVTDADFALLPEGLDQQYLDFLEVVVWEVCARGSSSGPQSVSWPNFSASTGGNAQWLASQVEDLRRAYNAKYAVGGVIVVGTTRRGIHGLLHERRHRRRWPCD